MLERGMLVIARKVGERFFIGDDIEIEIKSVSEHNRVRVAIRAPRDIRIRRDSIPAKVVAHGRG